MSLNKPVVQRILLCSQQHCITSKRFGWFDRKKRSFFGELTDKEEPRFFSETEPNPLADIERRIEISKERLQWRSPIPQRLTVITEGLHLQNIIRIIPFHSSIFFIYSV